MNSKRDHAEQLRQTIQEKGSKFKEPVGDPWADGPERRVASLYADEELVLAGGREDGLWVIGRSFPAAEPWRAWLPTVLRGGAAGAAAR